MSLSDALENTTREPDAQGLCLAAIDAWDQPGFTALVKAWTSQRGTALTPAAETFDLVEIAQHLENAVRLSFDGPDAASFKFVGPAVCARLQGDPTGTNLFDYIRHLPVDGSAILQKIFAAPVGVHIVFQISYKSGRLAQNQGLYLPLISRQNGCNHLFGMQASGTTLTYESDGPSAVNATKLASAKWVALGAGIPAEPLPC